MPVFRMRIPTLIFALAVFVHRRDNATAQVALGDRHFKIQKTVSDGKTYTHVNALDHEGRKNELARIIGGVELTQATLDYAEEMLKGNG